MSRSGTPEIPNDAANPAGRRSLIKAGQRNRTGTLVPTPFTPRLKYRYLLVSRHRTAIPRMRRCQQTCSTCPRVVPTFLVRTPSHSSFSQSIEHLPSTCTIYLDHIFVLAFSYISSSTLIVLKQSLYPYRHIWPTLCFSVQPRVSRSRSPDCAHRNRNAHRRSRVSFPLRTQKKRS